ERVRSGHKPAIFHVVEITQPQGHSTSGSHERYKSKERLKFEKDFDCIARMRVWLVGQGIASESQIEGWEAADKEAVEAARDLAWEAYQSPIREERDRLVALLGQAGTHETQTIAGDLAESSKVTRAMVMGAASRALGAMRGLKPICDIQYLDYLFYALEEASDDLATLHWRTVGGHKAPVIIRTKGHRLVGIWHSGSPMAVLLHALRGIYIAVPRNMTQ